MSKIVFTDHFQGGRVNLLSTTGSINAALPLCWSYWRIWVNLVSTLKLLKNYFNFINIIYKSCNAILKFY